LTQLPIIAHFCPLLYSYKNILLKNSFYDRLLKLKNQKMSLVLNIKNPDSFESGFQRDFSNHAQLVSFIIF